MDSKVRAKLRAMAMKMDDTVIIGKEGLTDNVKQQIDDSLNAHELIKLKILETCEFSAKEYINDLAKIMRAEPIQAVGRKMVIYRKSFRKDITHIDISIPRRKKQWI